MAPVIPRTDASGNTYEEDQETELDIVGLKHINPLLCDCVALTQERHDRTKILNFTGTPTGFKDFDQLTLGLHSGELTLIAGPVGVGKTAFALDLMVNVAMNSRFPVSMFSLGCGEEHLTARLLAATGAINFDSLATGNLTDSEWHQMSLALGKLHELPIFIDDSPRLTAHTIESRVLQLYQQYGGLGCVIIDALHLLYAPPVTPTRERNAFSRILKILRTFATRLNVPLIVLFQTKLSDEAGSNRRPLLSDLNNHGISELDFDCVSFLYSDERYEHRNKTQKISTDCLIARNRHGPTGLVKLSFDQTSLSFQSEETEQLQDCKLLQDQKTCFH